MSRKRTSQSGSILPPRPSKDLLDAEEWNAVCECLLRRPPKAIRLRRPESMGRGTSVPLPFESQPVPWYPDGRVLIDEHQPGQSLLYAAGTYYVQDAGSMLALRLLSPLPHERILDLCAAPGAKASAILEITGPGGGLLVANEVIRSRLAPLEFSLARTGWDRYAVTSQDPEDLARVLSVWFDAILVDAPCSGQTLVSRGRHDQSAFLPSEIRHCAARQTRILNAAAEMLRPGGRLVYSTCTFSVEENEDVVARFLDEHPGWILSREADLTAYQSKLMPEACRLWPHRDFCAGGFAVRLIKPGGETPPSPTSASVHTAPGVQQVLVFDDETGGTLRDIRLEERGNRQFGWRHDLPLQLSAITAGGPEIAYKPSRVWLPSHQLALRRCPTWDPHHRLELDDLNACRYVTGQTLPSAGKGWQIVEWNGHPLGWIHSTAQRSNNHLPAPARISAVQRPPS